MSEIIKIANSSNAFLEEVEKISGEKVTKCIQCGICSASCPMADGMDHTPSQIMYLVQMDQEKLISSDTIWRCSACLSCKARCPRGIDLAKVAEAVREINLRNTVDHLKLDHLTPEELEDLPTIALVAACRKLTN